MSFLVPVDLSAPSHAAIELAVLVGRATGEEAVVLHVTEGTPSLDLLADLYEVTWPLRQAGVRARLRTLQGDPAQIIQTEASRRHCRWVVMGTRGHLDQAGSTAAAVMRACTVPTLAMRPGSEERQEISRVSLWARPRSQAPQAWDIASLLGNLLNSPVDMQGAVCGPGRRGPCSADALLVLDMLNLPPTGLACTLEAERCRVLLVAPPTSASVQ